MPTASSKTRAPSSRCPAAAAIVSPAFQPLPCHLRALHAHARTAGRVLITLYVTLRRVSTRAASQHVLRPHSPIVSSSALSIAGARIDVHDACDGSLMVPITDSTVEQDASDYATPVWQPAIVSSCWCSALRQ